MRTYNNFKVVKISFTDGAYTLLASGLSEAAAQVYASKMEEKQSGLIRRTAWYATTDAGDWQNMAAAFYRLRTQY